MMRRLYLRYEILVRDVWLFALITLAVWDYWQVRRRRRFWERMSRG